MNERILTKVGPEILPWKVKLLYGAGGFAKALLAVTMAAFMLFFYVDVCRIPSVVASNIVLIAKVWDIINDPMMGAIVDRVKSKEGKCRFWLKYMSVPAIVLVALCFYMPDISQNGKFIWVAVTYLLQGMVSTSLLIPLNTMISRLSSDPKQRVNLSQVDGIAQMISQWMVVSLTMRFVGILGQGDMQKGFLYVGIIYAIIYGICHLIVYFATRGYEPVEMLAENYIEPPKQTIGEVFERSCSQSYCIFIKTKRFYFAVQLHFCTQFGNCS